MVDAVCSKVPTVWTSSPSAWFVLKGVTQDDTKYYHVVAALDSATAIRALSIITSTLDTEKFKAIKTLNYHNVNEKLL